MSTKKVCQLTGEDDRQPHPAQPTVNRTATNWGLTGTDNGFSFDYGGKLWFLFGDSHPTTTFHGRPNEHNVPLRRPGDNDSMAYSTDTTVSGCVHLQFVPDATGAFARPTVITHPGQAPVTLRTNEVPEAGISVGNQMYVVFGTDNFASNPTSGPAHPDGGPTRSVVAQAVNGAADLQFRYLYDLSTRPAGKFTFVALAEGSDGFVDVWGTQADGSSYRHSPAYFARKPASQFATSGGFQYFTGTDGNGQPRFSNSESDAVPVVTDVPENCLGELSVQWNTYLNRWMMLYNCSDSTAANPRGIYLRVAPQPWGPWSPPTTIFARSDGVCQFIHRAVTAGQPACDALSSSDRADVEGGDYAPGIMSRFTVGAAATSSSPAWTTIYYTMSTWNPYQVVVMESTVRAASP